MQKKALLFTNEVFHLINYLNTGYWVGEDTLAYYNDSGNLAQGDLLGRLILIEHCNKLILEEFYSGIFKEDYKEVEVEQKDFNRKMDTSKFKNWIAWKTKHKMYIVKDIV